MKCVVESINLDDEYKRYFIIKCTDEDNDAYPVDRYPMSYEDIRKYMDVDQQDDYMHLLITFDYPCLT